jgi:hypothetical protein
MPYTCSQCGEIVSKRNNDVCPRGGVHDFKEIPDKPSKKPEYTPLDEAEDISEKDHISKKSSEKDHISKKSYSINPSHCISLIADAASKPFKALARGVMGSKDVEYVRNDYQESNAVGLDEGIEPQMQAASKLKEADKALQEEEDFYRDKKNTQIIGKIQLRLLQGEEKDKNVELENDKLIDELSKTRDDLLKLKASQSGVGDEKAINLEEAEKVWEKVLLEDPEMVGLDSEGDTDINEDEGGTGDKLKKLKKLREDAKKSFDKLRRLLKSNEESEEGANDLADIASTCSEFAKALSEHAGHVEHLGHAANAAAALPIVGAAINFALLAKDIMQLSSVWRRIAKQHKIREEIFAGQGENAPNEGLVAALDCIKNIQVEERRFLAADIAWQSTMAAGHLATLTGVGAVGGAPVTIAGAVASSVTKVGKKLLDYKHAEDHLKAVKASEQDELNDDNAVKIIKHNPRKATQIIINQAKTDGYQGDRARDYLEYTFGVKGDLIDDIKSDDKASKMVANQVTREKVLEKLDRKDEDPARIQDDLKKAGTAIKNYVPSSRKLKALRNLREAKNLLMMNAKANRSTVWLTRNTIVSTDPEEEMAQILAAVLQGIENGELDGEDDDIKLAIAHLQPIQKDEGFGRV